MKLINEIENEKIKSYMMQLCKRLQILNKTKTLEEMDDIIWELDLPFKWHLFVATNYEEIMTYTYN